MFSLELQNVSQSFKEANKKIKLFDDINLSIPKGEIVCMLGQSGSGKTTMLQIAGLLDKAKKGDVLIDGVSTRKLSRHKKTLLRREKIGFVYQHHHLLSDFTAQENIMMPMLIAGLSRDDAEERANILLAEIKLSDRATHRPAELSGGERQRVAIARAVANKPSILLADEPTGNLDSKTSEDIMQWLVRMAKKDNISMLLVTHDKDMLGIANASYHLKNRNIELVLS